MITLLPGFFDSRANASPMDCTSSGWITVNAFRPTNFFDAEAESSSDALIDVIFRFQ
jgi:hypothetical protein